MTNQFSQPRALGRAAVRPAAVAGAALLAAALGGVPGAAFAGGAGAGDSPESPSLGPPGLPERLSETGLYQPGDPTQVRAGNLLFAPQYPLWSDGAHKTRWIHIPAGQYIDASQPDAWVFPIGTRFWKEFRFYQRVETRMIERLADGSWRYASYAWDADGRDATLAPARGLRAAGQVRPGLAHDIPARGDCRVCHEGDGRPAPVLGFGALQLSPDRDPLAPNAEVLPAGAVDLRALVERGLVRGLPARFLAHPPRIQAATPVARAALGYLHANCGGCHNAAAPLGTVDLQLDQKVAATAIDPARGRPLSVPPWGVPPSGVPPSRVLQSIIGQPSLFRSARRPEAAFRVVPGRPALSTLVLRLRSREAAVQMPPLGTQLVDDAAIALIERWISELPTPPTPASRHAAAAVPMKEEK